MTNFDAVLDNAVKNGFNVLMIGKHGVGKTHMFFDAMKRNGINNARYFSAATMDPWVDFIGVPKEHIDSNGISTLQLVKPADFANDKVEAIFFDEFNRSPKKVRNAVMELLQFGSINGAKFKNLRFVWAAINPHDDEHTYDVEKLDPAQLDRFHLRIEVPSKPDLSYFKTKFGEIGELAVKWWNDQKQDVKDALSPRGLDYALMVHNAGGDVRYSLTDKRINASSFVQYIEAGNPVKDLEKLISMTPEEIKAYFQDHNKLQRIKPDLLAKQKFATILCRYLPIEEILAELQPKRKRSQLVADVELNPGNYPDIHSPVLDNEFAYHPTVVDAIKKFKANPVATQPTTNSPLTGKNVAITGTSGGYTRGQLANLIVNAGGNVHSTVTRTTDMLLTLDTPGQTKLNQARRYNVTIMNKDQSAKLLGLIL